MRHPYTLVRSNRKTVALTVTRALEIVVRAPTKMKPADVDRFVAAHAGWIEEHLALQQAYAAAHPEPTQAEAEALRLQAEAYLPGRVKHYAAAMGYQPAGLRVTGAKTRFGSCSGQNRLCFSYRLMRYPIEAVDYVVVHELAHIPHKNHGPDFWRLVERIMPDYKARRALLKG